MGFFIPWRSVGICIHHQKLQNCFQAVVSFWLMEGENTWDIACRAALKLDDTCTWTEEEVYEKALDAGKYIGSVGGRLIQLGESVRRRRRPWCCIHLVCSRWKSAPDVGG